jgi:hypothetical protein
MRLAGLSDDGTEARRDEEFVRIVILGDSDPAPTLVRPEAERAGSRRNQRKRHER